jgi:hypothetical protein
LAQTATTLLDVLREVWTTETIVKQFEAKNGPLARIKKVKGTMIGKQAQVPIHKGRNLAGYTSVGAGGGSLNSAGAQQVDQGTYTLVYHWLSVELDTAALLQASGSNAQSIVGAKDLEISEGLENIDHQATRQLMTNGDGIVAQCDTGGASTTVSLLASPSGTAYGYDALVRGWLGVGSVVDIGTTADTDSLVTGTTVSGIADTASAPTITVGTSISTTSGTHFVYIANPNSATAANPETNGLRNIVNTTGSLGGLSPANAGEEFWKAAARDTSTSTLSLDLMLSLSRQVRQRTGNRETDVWTSLKQGDNYNLLLQNQVRFAGPSTSANADTPGWNGLQVEAFPDVLDSDMFFLTLSDFCRITGGTDGAKWASQIGGDGQPGGLWAQGTTSFKDAVVMPLQVGVNRRNSQAAATALTV